MHQWEDSGGSSYMTSNTSVLHTKWFPWVLGAAAAACVIIIVLVICWCCRHRFRSKSASVTSSSENVFLRFLQPPLTSPHTKPTVVQPAAPPQDYMVGQQPQGVSLINPQIPGTRTRNKGLLESRRGSHTSLTLSLSPSLDSNITGSGTSPSRELKDMELLTVKSQRMTREELRYKLDHNSAALFKEFWEIPMNHTSKRDIPIRGIGQKNRYQSIIPNEATRVVLPQIHNDVLSTYINANYIRGYNGVERGFIATQGPMPHTIEDFWRMIWFTHCPVVVMITNLIEKNKRKCEQYLPKNDSQTFGPIHVCSISCEEHDGYSVRHIILRCQEEERSCLHLWYPSWPDHTTPTTARQLLRLVAACHTRPTTGPIVVHCSAGLGRTGCFIALCIGCQQLQQDGSVDVLGIVCRMRLDRGGLVQTNEQYEFIHHTLASYELERHHTGQEDYSPL